jgi:hypothetical protein
MKRFILLTIFLGMFLIVSVAESQLTGAIFTTDSTCSGVNVNFFSSKMDVYLDGGPHKPGAAGLPDGYYYVKVTDPSGAELLGYSTTAVIQVSGGEFVNCYQLWDILVKGSDGSQGYDTTPNSGGVYKVWISQDSSFPSNESKTDNFKVKEEGGGPPQETAVLEVKKFYDADVDGIKDDGEVELEGWKIGITDSINLCRFTPVSVTLDPDSYTVFEYNPLESNWVPTTPQSVNITLDPGETETVLFGNVCLGSGGGKTLGFWSNKNGQAKLNDDGGMNSEFAMLSGYCLRNALGGDFDPTTYTQFRSWLLGANATNMAYMLSAQLAAMALNVEAGFVSGSSIVYAPGCGDMGMGNNFITISNLITKANDELCAHGYTPAGDPNRALQECLKNALDNANNNKNFVQPTPCSYSFEPCQ